MRKGLMGIVLPMLVVAGLVWGVRWFGNTKLYTAVTALAGLVTPVGMVRLFLLASLTTVAAVVDGGAVGGSDDDRRGLVLGI